MLLLGIDVGTSSVKASVVDAATQKTLASAHYPDTESEIISLQPGWAEQSPGQWWDDVKITIRKLHATKAYDPADIKAIGIAYQMHGLVITGEKGEPLRHAIIWCDSRAVKTGEKAADAIGKKRCRERLLNSPGNFTASKLAWIKKHEPRVFEQIENVMLPGDYISYKLTGERCTTIPALSEGMFWDFLKHELSKDIFEHFDFRKKMIPACRDIFGEHGKLNADVAAELSLPVGTPVTYKAGDQPNNAFALNVMNPGEVAASAGTSGVIYAISDQLYGDKRSRVNSFAHVNHSDKKTRIGVLLNINGAGIANSWVRKITGETAAYKDLDLQAARVKPGCEGLFFFPFGNGAERMLDNRILNAYIYGIDFNRHEPAHVHRAVQEGVAFAFRYGLDIMRENEVNPSVIRAPKANLFLSPVFTEAFANSTNTALELYETVGSRGAAIGAGLGAGIYSSHSEAFAQTDPVKIIMPNQSELWNELYHKWKGLLDQQIKMLGDDTDDDD